LSSLTRRHCQDALRKRVLQFHSRTKTDQFGFIRAIRPRVSRTERGGRREREDHRDRPPSPDGGPESTHLYLAKRSYVRNRALRPFEPGLLASQDLAESVILSDRINLALEGSKQVPDLREAGVYLVDSLPLGSKGIKGAGHPYLSHDRSSLWPENDECE
jgi:hypothetical protein